MLYLDESDIRNSGIIHDETIGVIEKAVGYLDAGVFSQPLKPYLRYGNPKNRIIAMPAYIGGDFTVAGLKWIASFPDNIGKNIPRANSIVILNNAETGEVFCVINGALLSVIRTMSVSGLMIRYFDRCRGLGKVNVGITGWGPIGRYHAGMCRAILKDRIERISVYELSPSLRNGDLTPEIENLRFVERWEDAYSDADIFITCTVAGERYINRKPKQGSLLLNVSLRDYAVDVFEYVKGGIVVDDWQEVCRENTDIEVMHKEAGLREGDCMTIGDIVVRNALLKKRSDETIMFNPMGMAIFDIAMGKYYYEKAKNYGYGREL